MVVRVIGETKYFHPVSNIQISKQEYDRLRTEFETKRDADYERIVDAIVSSIPSNITEEEKLRIVFEYFVNNFEYEYSVLNNPSVSGYVRPIYFQYGNGFKISIGEKYSPILFKRGICASFSQAYADICQRLGIDCQEIEGKTIALDNKGTRMAHGWNVINNGTQIKHIDITYAIYNRDQGKNPQDFFLISAEKLQAIGPHNSFVIPVNKSR